MAWTALDGAVSPMMSLLARLRSGGTGRHMTQSQVQVICGSSGERIDLAEFVRDRAHELFIRESVGASAIDGEQSDLVLTVSQVRQVNS